MPSGWRIVQAKYAPTAFSGEGARLFGGRWNSPGLPLVYLSAHQSLAALEILIHSRPLSPRGDYVAIHAEWEDSLMERLLERKLPDGWRLSPPGLATMRIGDDWARAKRSPVLAVPSAIIPSETNFLLNPVHPDFGRIARAKPLPFVFDVRLLPR